MASIEEKRSDFIPTSDDKCSHCKGHNGVNLSDRTKLFLLVLSVSVSFFLGSLSAFRMNLSSSDPDRELMENYSSIQENLSSYHAQSWNLSVDGWTVCRTHGMIYFSNDERDWSSSRDVCVSIGADLVTITSQTQQDFLVSKIKETHWIGLNDLETEGRWVWVNNKTLEETGVKFWYERESGKSEPDNWKVMDPSGENCASLGDGNGNLHTWFDGSCKDLRRFICENK
nr:CD209 antigen-like protein D [Misgurnus anguillicaudatus]